MKDNYQRKIEYLRLSITDACNLKCAYCKKNTAPRKQLELTEIKQLLPAFVSVGIKKIRLTGGEPLLHPDILGIVKACTEARFEDIAMTTNALLLAEKAQLLKDNGLQRVNISLNSLEAENYKNITGVDGLEKVLAGIEAAKIAGLCPIKINVVLMRGKNEHEIQDFVHLTKELPYQVRFIEYMKMGAELAADSIRITQDEILSKHPELIRCEQEDTPSAQVYKVKGYTGSVGFISPVTAPFCEHCTRMRVTSGLTLRPCLGNNAEVDLRKALQENTLEQVITAAILSKPQQGFCKGFETKRPMSEIGG